MVGVILDEKKLVKDALEKGIIDKKPMITIGLLIKYYHIEGMDKKQINNQIIDFMKKYYKDFSINKWYKKINSAIDKFHKNANKYKSNSKLIEIESISITKGELENIEALENLKLEKIAFIMLVYAKISNIIMNNNEGWINKSCATICKEAKVSVKKGEKKEMLFNQLYNKQYILQRKNNSKTSIKVNYQYEDSDEEIIIDNFDEVIYYYLIFKGGKYKKCEICGKYIKVRSSKDNSKKYCNNCAREIAQEQKNKWKRENW